MRRIVTLGFVLVLAGCVTPLGRSEIETLTTCKDTDIKKIRKNLLLAGYEIKSESDGDITTDFKQVQGWGQDRGLRRITVVKIDDKTFKFNVRIRNVRVEKSNSGLTVGSGDAKKSNNINIDLSQPIETTNDNDQSYYEEYRDDYRGTQQEVCGR